MSSCALSLRRVHVHDDRRPTSFVLADTETLHQKIAMMSDRIRQLEDALAILQSTISGPAGESHPLLQRDLLKIKSSIELHSASVSGAQDEARARAEEDDGGEDAELQDTFGTLAIRDDGVATFYGRSAGSEVRPSITFFLAYVQLRGTSVPFTRESCPFRGRTAIYV